jgi:hypothetical protein
MARGSTVWVNVPRRDVAEVGLHYIGDFDDGATVCGCEMGGYRITIYRGRSSTLRERCEISADAATEVDHDGGRQARRSIANDASGLVCRNPLVGGLLQAHARKEHAVGLRKLCGCPTAQLRLFDEKVSPFGRDFAAQARQ